MKLLTEYIERARQLENVAQGESDPKFKANLLRQADAYRQLAAHRAEQFGLPFASPLKKPE